ncbi:MAG: ABC transporter permease [Candidatus Ozemobacteraceae bacterium]
MKRWSARFLFFGFAALIWCGISYVKIFDPFLFPAPWDVGRALEKGFLDGSFISGLWASLNRLLVGFSISFLIGTPLGFLLGRFALIDWVVGPLTIGLQALPSVCWLPPAALWFGLNDRAMIFIVVMGSLMAQVISVRDGVRTISPALLRNARVLGATGWKNFVYVILPASFPAILTGAKLGWSFAWRSLMAAELLYIDAGLGSILWTARELHDMPRVAAAMLVIITVGVIVDRVIFENLEKWVQKRWGF